MNKFKKKLSKFTENSFQIMPLENEMKSPKSFVGLTGVLNRAFAIIVFLYVGMGLFGYLKYGGEIKGSLTLNLPSEEMYVCNRILKKQNSF